MMNEGFKQTFSKVDSHFEKKKHCSVLKNAVNYDLIKNISANNLKD